MRCDKFTIVVISGIFKSCFYMINIIIFYLYPIRIALFEIFVVVLSNVVVFRNIAFNAVCCVVCMYVVVKLVHP